MFAEDVHLLSSIILSKNLYWTFHQLTLLSQF